MKKIIIIISSLLLLLGVGYYFLSNLDKENGINRPIYFIPSDAAYVIETETPIEAWKSLKNNLLWKHLLKNKTVQSLSSGLTSLDEIMTTNQFAFDLLGDRKLLVSAHKYKHDDYDFLYVIDVENKLQTDFVQDILNRVIDKEYYQLTSRKYKDNFILELFDKNYKETIYISVYENILIASYVGSLVEKSLDEYNNPVIGRDINFIEVANNIEASDFFKLYLNYKVLPDFAALFLEDDNSLVGDISQSLFYSGYSFDINDEGLMKMKGVTLPNDTLNSFLNSLHKSGKGKNEVQKVLPDLTAFYLKIGFESGMTFIENFEKMYQENDSIGFHDYQINNKKIERFLNINLQKNFYSWIGDEVAFMQLQSGGLGTKNEFAFLVKAEDIDNAKKNLDFIKTRIKKKTPGKFKSVDYKGYEINYLSIKGFFKAIMGKFFSKLEKPYYTIIDDFVVFSNHPQTLRIMIDQYLDQKTLSNSNEYNSFIDEFPKTSNVFCYFHTKKLFTNILEFSDQDTKKSMLKNKDFITCFEQFGFQMVKDDEFFNTSLISTFKDPEQIVIQNDLKFNLLDPLSFKSDGVEVVEEKDIFSTLDVNLSDFDVKKYEEFYDNENLKVEVEIEDGIRDGYYKQYYEDGTLMLKGHFKNDLKDGVWKFYSSDGKVLEKRNYDEGKVEAE